MSLPVENIILLETGTECKGRDECIQMVRYMQVLHIESYQHCDIDYNFLITKDGEVFIGRSWEYIGSPTIGCDNNTICIALIGQFNKDHKPSEKQLEALEILLNVGKILRKITEDYKLVDHNNINSTINIKFSDKELFNIIKIWPQWKSYYENSSINYV